MRKALSCVLLLLFIANALYGQISRRREGKPLIETYDTKTYKGDRQVWAITQDKRGVMYFGHNKGLIEYDGVSWRKIAIPGNKRVRSLAVDDQNTVYVSSVGDFGYLAPGKNGYLQYISLLPALPKDKRNFSDVWRVVTVKNQVFFVSFPYVFCFRNKKLIQSHQTSKTNIFHLSYNVANYWYQPVRNVGIMTTAGDSLAAIAGTGTIGEFRVFSMLPYPGQKILMAEATTGFWLYDTKTRKTTRMPSELDKDWSTYIIYCGVTLPNGLYAFGTRVRGVVIMNRQGKIIDLIDKTKGLPDNTAWSIYYEPKSQNLWVGTDRGIARIEVNSPLEYFDETHGLEGSIDHMLRYNGNLYVSSSVGAFRMKQGRFARVKGVKRQSWGLCNYKVPSTSQSRLLLGNNLGLYDLKDTLTKVAFPELTVYRMLADRTNPERLYLCFANGLGTRTYQQGKWETETRRFKGMTDPLRQVVQDRQNRIWVTTRYKGVGLLENKQMTAFDSTAGLPLRRVYIRAYQDTLYYLTNQGIYAFDNTSRRFNLTKKFDQLLGSHQVSFVAFDTTQTWWAIKNTGKSANKNLYVPYVRQQQGYRSDSLVFKPLYDKSLDRITIESNGIYWVSSDEGLFRYDARSPFLVQKKFAAIIRKVQTSHDLLLFAGYRQAAPPVLPYADNSLVFDYAALYYGFAPKNEYSYRLDGYETKWSKWTKSSKKEYTNLYEGKYTFKVKARNLYGIESTIATYSFSILPPWYRTWWAFGLYIILFGLTILGSIKLYTVRLQEQKLTLEKKVLSRTYEVVQQKEEILAQNEELRQQSEEITAQRDAIEKTNKALNMQNMHVKQSIKSAETIQSAILPLTQDLKKALHEHFVVFYPRDIVSGDFYYLATLGNQTIVAAIDCTGHGVPGAFMSLIGYALLNDIINARQKTDPGEILEALRIELKIALKQEQTGRRNGMDVAMVTLEQIDTNQVKVLFAGARRPLWYTEAGSKDMQQISGSKVSIGFHYENVRTVVTHQLLLARGTVLYLGSDGFADQNNRYRKKFGSVQLVNLLVENSDLPMHKQKEQIEGVLEDFMYETEQRDDILLLGIKL